MTASAYWKTRIWAQELVRNLIMEWKYEKPDPEQGSLIGRWPSIILELLDAATPRIILNEKRVCLQRTSHGKRLDNSREPFLKVYETQDKWVCIC